MGMIEQQAPVPEPQEPRVPSRKLYDAEYRYHGYYDAEPEGLSRVRIFDRGEEPPVLVITDLPENPTTSVTNLAETLVPEIMRDLIPHRFDYDVPAIVIEHLPPLPRDEQRQIGIREYRKTDEYSQVTFPSWKRKLVWIGGRQRLSLGDPDWRHMPHEEVAALIGEGEVGSQPGS
jgi:hypothetical protein